MILLYCNGGAVVGNHVDAQNVPTSAYGTGTRIIPWAGNWGDLTKVGAAPPAGTPDTRPYAEPPATKTTLLAYAAQLRWETSVEGISFVAASGTIPVKTDRVSQTLLGDLALYAQTLAGTAAIDFTQSNVHYAITAAEAISISNAVRAHIQTGRTIETTCITDLNSVTPTILTYVDVEIEFGSPTLTSISPTTYVSGTATTITATGTNFVSTSQILISGTAETTTFVSATQLTATAPATLVAGTYNVTIQNPNGFSSSAQVLTLT